MPPGLQACVPRDVSCRTSRCPRKLGGSCQHVHGCGGICKGGYASAYPPNRDGLGCSAVHHVRAVVGVAVGGGPACPTHCKMGGVGWPGAPMSCRYSMSDAITPFTGLLTRSIAASTGAPHSLLRPHLHRVGGLLVGCLVGIHPVGGCRVGPVGWVAGRWVVRVRQHGRILLLQGCRGVARAQATTAVCSIGRPQRSSALHGAHCHLDSEQQRHGKPPLAVASLIICSLRWSASIIASLICVSILADSEMVRLGNCSQVRNLSRPNVRNPACAN